ncbi:MAG: hypothetical protein FWE37_09050 [Spirochaetaceae bacterium]|nr:hypothetical protein [Spirochaetaceae bacterium]
MKKILIVPLFLLAANLYGWGIGVDGGLSVDFFRNDSLDAINAGPFPLTVAKFEVGLNMGFGNINNVTGQAGFIYRQGSAAIGYFDTVENELVPLNYFVSRGGSAYYLRHVSGWQPNPAFDFFWGLGPELGADYQLVNDDNDEEITRALATYAGLRLGIGMRLILGGRWEIGLNLFTTVGLGLDVGFGDKINFPNSMSYSQPPEISIRPYPYVANKLGLTVRFWFNRSVSN